MFIHSQTGSIFCYFDSVQPAIRENFRIVNWFDIVRMAKRSERIDRGSYFVFVQCTSMQAYTATTSKHWSANYYYIFYFASHSELNNSILFAYILICSAQPISHFSSLEFFFHFFEKSEQMKKFMTLWMIILKPFIENSFRWKFKVFSKDS